jgi:tRNA pseudouridine55 synthase
MQKILLLKKQIGETPLETIQHFKKDNLEYQNQKMAYAGRLDPMAEGLLLVLVDEECKKRKDYEKLSKIYEFKILFGVSTDTFDLMGKVTNFNISSMVRREDIQKIIPKFIGKYLQEYPPYSSKRIKGKPLFWWARENRLKEINIPKKDVEVYKLKLIDLKSITSKKLLKEIYKRVGIIKGEFRQKEILNIWDKKLKNKKAEFLVASFIIKCSSGFYVRSFANNIGKKLKIPTLAFLIKRTEIGNFKLKDI